MGELEIEDLDLADLVEAFRQIVASVDFARLGEHEVISDDTPLELHVENIIEHLQAKIASGAVGSSVTAFTHRRQDPSRDGRDVSWRFWYSSATNASASA